MNKCKLTNRKFKLRKIRTMDYNNNNNIYNFCAFEFIYLLKLFMHFALPFVMLVFCSSGSFLLVGTQNNDAGFRRNNNREEHIHLSTFFSMQVLFFKEQESIILILFYTQYHPFPRGHKLRSQLIFLHTVILRCAALLFIWRVTTFSIALTLVILCFISSSDIKFSQRRNFTNSLREIGEVLVQQHGFNGGECSLMSTFI